MQLFFIPKKYILKVGNCTFNIRKLGILINVIKRVLHTTYYIHYIYYTIVYIYIHTMYYRGLLYLHIVNTVINLTYNVNTPCTITITCCFPIVIYYNI